MDRPKTSWEAAAIAFSHPDYHPPVVAPPFDPMAVCRMVYRPKVEMTTDGWKVYPVEFDVYQFEELTLVGRAVHSERWMEVLPGDAIRSWVKWG